MFVCLFPGGDPTHSPTSHLARGSRWHQADILQPHPPVPPRLLAFQRLGPRPRPALSGHQDGVSALLARVPLAPSQEPAQSPLRREHQHGWYPYPTVPCAARQGPVPADPGGPHCSSPLHFYYYYFQILKLPILRNNSASGPF